MMIGQNQIELEEGFQIQEEIVNSVSFNSDNSCLALATSRGFKIFTVQPLFLKQHRVLGAPLQIVQMADRTNLLAFVGFQNTAFVADRIAIFDDSNNNIIGDLSFNSHVLAVKIRLKKMLVALTNKVYLIDLLTLETEIILPTAPYVQIQKYNLISMSNDPDNFIIAVPSYDKGHVTLAYLSRNRQRRIKAHQSLLSCVVLTPNGDKLATSSEKGMNIRIFCTEKGQCLQEVRRGNEYGVIYSLSFSKEGSWLACSSDSCNIHIFAVKPSESQVNKKYENSVQEKKSNPKSKLYFLRKFFPFFDAEYSYCYYEMQDFQADMQSFVAFGFHDSSLMVVNDYGTFRILELNLKGGACRQLQQDQQLLDKELGAQKKYL